MKLIPYLMFREGKCREAFDFYAQALRGEIVAITTYGDMGMADMPEAMKSLIANIQLSAGSAVIMASDGVENPDGQATTSVNIEVDSVEEAERVFAAMSVGGNIRMPLAESAWALRFGMFDDRYGQPWMVNCMKPLPSAGRVTGHDATDPGEPAGARSGEIQGVPRRARLLDRPEVRQRGCRRRGRVRPDVVPLDGGPTQPHEGANR